MFDIKPDDLISKTDMLLFGILEELKQLNKSLNPIAKGLEIKKPIIRSTQKRKPKVVQRKTENPINAEILEEKLNGCNTTN